MFAFIPNFGHHLSHDHPSARCDNLGPVGVYAILQKRHSPSFNMFWELSGMTTQPGQPGAGADLSCYLVNNLPDVYLNKTGNSCHLVTRCTREN